MNECEQARGRMIDDDMKMAVMFKRSPKEVGEHIVLESAQLANVEFKFPVMRELIQHWCQSRGVFFPQKPPMEIAAVGTAAGDSDVTVSAFAWNLARKGTRHRKQQRDEVKVKGKGKGKGKKSKEKGGEKGKERSEVIVVTFGNGAIRRPNALNGRDVARCNLVQG